ncbi:hypothetical protein QR680_014050 [Steinernema hermaphroditum]|uniref:Uncharacterized protein n=1 Tax=Steinernema hermaphroditum TaxID=289476 RepID=A0AA39I8X8_9BILA|nr:hypothetical protein QR680_014050 [Steinernema hermaphroditum]
MLANFVKRLCLCQSCHKKADGDGDDENDVYGAVALDDDLDNVIAEELFLKVRELAEAIRQHPDRVVHGAVFSIPTVEGRPVEHVDLVKLLDHIQRVFDREFGRPDEREVLSMDVEIVSDEDIEYALKKYENRLKRNLEAADAFEELEMEEGSEVSDEELQEIIEQFLSLEMAKGGEKRHPYARVSSWPPSPLPRGTTLVKMRPLEALLKFLCACCTRSKTDDGVDSESECYLREHASIEAILDEKLAESRSLQKTTLEDDEEITVVRNINELPTIKNMWFSDLPPFMQLEGDNLEPSSDVYIQRLEKFLTDWEESKKRDQALLDAQKGQK